MKTSHVNLYYQVLLTVKFTIIVIFLDSCVIYFALKSKLKLK